MDAATDADQDTHPDATTRPLGVVVGVDGSQIGLHAVRWAAAEARMRGLPLRIVHAAPYAAGGAGPGRRRAQDILARAFTVARRAEPGLSVATRQADEPPVHALLAAADQARLLVVGMGGGDQPQEVLIGSVALDVSGRASCPVAVVRGRHRVHTGERAVLVGVDSPAAEAAVLDAAFADARRHGSPLVVLHARHGHLREHRGGQEEAARSAEWDRLVDELGPWSARFPDVPVELHLVHAATPTRALLVAAIEARLVVLGTRARGAPQRVLFGSTSREVLRRCPVPVLVISPEVKVLDVEPAPAVSPAAARAEPAFSVVGAEDPHDRGRLW